ncbi:MAG: hypothetical protein QOD12_2983 [Verrucomicrobiota bacterium]|jgi:hypothetical protein
MKRFFAVFVLTPAEQRLVIFVVLLIVAGAYYKHHRDLTFSGTPRPAETATPALSPSPNER